MNFRLFLLPLALGAVILGAVAALRPLEAQVSPTEQPGIGIPYCQVAGKEFDGISIFWHHAGAEPTGTYKWKVERRHLSDDGFVYKRWVLNADGTGAPAITEFERTEAYAPVIYWQFSDGAADLGEHYTYRVRALNEDETDMSGRYWSRRAPVQCEDLCEEYVNIYDGDPAHFEGDD